MNKQDFKRISDNLLNTARNIMADKGPEYTVGDEDVLNNFKSTAKKLGVDPLIVWYSYFDKQVSSVAAHVSNEDLNEAEPMLSRFADIINYAQLGYALFRERDNL